MTIRPYFWLLPTPYTLHLKQLIDSIASSQTTQGGILTMNLIIAIIQPDKLEDVQKALVKLGIQDMTVIDAKGFGRQNGHTLDVLGVQDIKGGSFMVEFTSKLQLEIVVSLIETRTVVDAIVRAARTGKIGDGKIFVIPAIEVVNIRTEERDTVALA
jgi:nitrogen regulatory protein PII